MSLEHSVMAESGQNVSVFCIYIHNMVEELDNLLFPLKSVK